jgi:hypothetical protein
VLSYHSGEDRIVKERFASAAGACDCPDDLPCVCGAIQTVRIVRGSRNGERTTNGNGTVERPPHGCASSNALEATRKSDGRPVEDR